MIWFAAYILGMPLDPWQQWLVIHHQVRAHDPAGGCQMVNCRCGTGDAGPCTDGHGCPDCQDGPFDSAYHLTQHIVDIHGADPRDVRPHY